MKFSEIREEYYTHTAKASDLVRQLAYAGFAILWIFKTGTGLPQVPRALLPAAGFLALTLLFDALQYVMLARAWNKVAVNADAATQSVDDEYDVSMGVNDSGVRFYNRKVYALAAAYLSLVGGIFVLLVH